MIIPYIMENKTCLKPPTSLSCLQVFASYYQTQTNCERRLWTDHWLHTNQRWYFKCHSTTRGPPPPKKGHEKYHYHPIKKKNWLVHRVSQFMDPQWCNDPQITILKLYSHRIHGAAIYGNMAGYQKNIPPMLAYIPALWILWDSYIC